MKTLHILFSGLSGVGNVFFSFVQGDENKELEYEAFFLGAHIRNEYITKCSVNNIQWKFIQKKYKLDLNFSRTFISSVASSDSSVIFLDGSRFILIAKIGALFSRKKKKIIVTEHQANHLKKKPQWVGLAMAMFLADNIVFLTESFNEEIKRKFKWLYQPKKISIINNGIDLNFFKPAVKHLTEEKIIGMQSRIVAIKDHSTLIKAFALIKQQNPCIKIKLKIAGSGDQLESLQAFVKEAGLQNEILFTGLLNEMELLDFIHSLDIYVHASFGEAMSTAIMQAMACNLPIIASDVPGINNMIENNKTGILVPVKNDQALADAILYLLNNPSKAITLKEAAYNFATLHYSNKTMFAKYASLIHSIE